ncbi:MAG: hypothetical protein HZY75_00465 [Nocardioidaceae bacterium]|nr:MAG: hypothetical protein HZY75_00465 [Nocardioidaceae bacterium]
MKINGAVTEERSYDLAALQAEQQTTIADTYLSGGGSTSRNYTGVDLWRLLGLSDSSGGIGSYITPNVPGPQAPAAQHNDLTRYSVMVTATDCAQALFSLAEISPFFGGNPVLVATSQGAYNPDDLTPVTDSLGNSGFARISVPADQRGTRRTSNIVEIKVIAAPTPEVIWETPTAITPGTPVSDAVLNARAVHHGTEVPGTFTYDVPAGTVLEAGSHVISGLFVPTAPSSLTVARAEVTLVVAAAPVATISASKSVVKPGQAIKLSTVLSAETGALPGQTVQLLQRAYDASGFTPVAAVVTDADGAASVTVKPSKGTTYQWQFAGSTEQPATQSATQVVKIQPKVKLSVTKKKTKKGAKLTVDATTTPARSGAKATLWKQGKKTNAVLARGIVKANGKFRLVTSLKPGTYKVFVTVAAGAGNTKATSVVKVITVKKR